MAATKPLAGNRPYLVKEQPERNPWDDVFGNPEIRSPLTGKVQAELISLKDMRQLGASRREL